MRRFVCIFLLLLLPLHSFAMQGGWSPLGNAFDLSHEAEHLEGASHHHMDDGSIHYDDSGESAQHHAEHTASGHAVDLPSNAMPRVILLATPLVRGELQQHIPEHIPEQPQRPPQALG